MSFSESLDHIVSENRNHLLGQHASWKRVRLGDIAEILNGFPFPSAQFSSGGPGTPLIRIRDILRNATETYFHGVFPTEFLVDSGALLVGMDGDFNCSVWRGERALLNQRCCKISVSSNRYDPRLLAYCLPAYLAAIHAHTSAITVKHLSSRTVADIPLPLPPIGEQHRIADTLDELLPDLAAGVAALERVQARLKQYRASVLKAAVEGALTADWRAQHPDTEPASVLLQRILVERRRRWEEAQLEKFKASGKEPPNNWKTKYKEPTSPDTANLTTLPHGWCWTALGQCFSVCVGATPSRSNKAFWNGDIPWVTSGEVQFCRIFVTKERITAEGLHKTSTKLNPAGSVILNMIGEGKTRGKAGILEIAACNNQNCAAIQVPATPIPSQFIYLWLMFRYEQTRQLGSGNNQPAMNKSIVEQIAFPLPPLAEQEVLVETVQDQLSIIDHLEADLNAKLKSAQALRQSILRLAFTGQLVPQDPSDEPASELLKHIAADREERARPAKSAKAISKKNRRGRAVF